jgi:hypothetical protein
MVDLESNDSTIIPSVKDNVKVELGGDPSSLTRRTQTLNAAPRSSLSVTRSPLVGRVKYEAGAITTGRDDTAQADV